MAQLRRYPGGEADPPGSRGERGLGHADESSRELESCAQGDGTRGDAQNVGLGEFVGGAVQGERGVGVEGARRGLFIEDLVDGSNNVARSMDVAGLSTLAFAFVCAPV